jgi:hypothetical protein
LGVLGAELWVWNKVLENTSTISIRSEGVDAELCGCLHNSTIVRAEVLCLCARLLDRTKHEQDIVCALLRRDQADGSMDKKHPLVIYLDTQDYYNLSNPNCRLPDILEYINHEKNCGNIVIGYSYPLFFELLRKYDEAHKPDRLRIARFMKQLCGSNAFPYPTDLLSGAKFPNDGFWMPRDALEQFRPKQIEKMLISSIRESLREEPRVNRRYRRLLSNLSGIRKIMSEFSLTALSKDDFPGVPVSDEFLRGGYIHKFLEGTITRERLSKEFTRWLADPEYTMQIWYEYAGKENPLEKIINDSFTKLELCLNQMAQVMAQYRAVRKEAKAARSMFYRALNESNLPHDMRSAVKPPKLPQTLTFPEPNINFDAFLGAGRSGQFNHYLKLISKGAFMPMRSDFGDLLHLVYLPDVDLMRCDKRMAQIMKDCSHVEAIKLVDSLDDLPNRVEALKTT